MNFQESNRMELKEDYSNSFLKTVSAFSNEREGKIIFGVADDGRVVGCDDCTSLRLRIENAINDSIRPIPNFTLQVEEIEEKEIVILTVYKGCELPYFYKNQAYQRSDTASVPADVHQVRRWIMDSSNISFDRQVIQESDFTFNKLEAALISEVGIEKITDDLLRTMGLMVGEKYTNAGKLFADENNLTTGIDAVKFGDNISQFLKRKTIIQTSILEQFHQMESFFDEFYYDYEEIADGRRVKRIMIPRNAFREALANAIVHHDYMIPANVHVEFWDDYIEIVSPGGLPSGITEEQFQGGRVSILRNEIIASVFQRLNIIETFATGVHRIRNLYLGYSEEPKFKVLGNSISVILPKINYERKNVLDNRTKEILSFLKDQPRSRSEIQDMLKLGRTKTNEYIVLLQDLREIEKIGYGRATKYKLVDEDVID